MAESIPSLRRLVNELQVKIRELESRPPVVVEKIVNVAGPERIVDRLVYIDNPDHIKMIKTLQGKLCQSISQ